MPLIPSKPLSEAKAQFSEVMTDVVVRHHPLVVDRHRGKEAMALVSLPDLEAMLSSFRFDTQASIEDGEFVLVCPQLGLTSAGETFDEALDELVAAAEEYATDFFARHEFYRQTDRAPQAPWLMRLAVTDAHARRQLFIEPPESARLLA